MPLETNYDLGNRNIQIVNLPGHTIESVVIIDHDNKIAFTGDFLYNGALFVFDKQHLKIYLQSIDKFVFIIGEDYSIYGAHGVPRISYQFLLDSKSLFNCIVNSDCYSETIAQVFGKEPTVFQSLDKHATVLLVHAD